MSNKITKIGRSFIVAASLSVTPAHSFAEDPASPSASQAQADTPDKLTYIRSVTERTWIPAGEYPSGIPRQTSLPPHAVFESRNEKKTYKFACFDMEFLHLRGVQRLAATPDAGERSRITDDFLRPLEQGLKSLDCKTSVHDRRATQASAPGTSLALRAG